MNKILILANVLERLSLKKEADDLKYFTKVSKDKTTYVNEPRWFYHIVVSGDNVEKIAKKYYKDVNPDIISLIVKDNNIKMNEKKNYTLNIGDKIKLRDVTNLYYAIGLFNRGMKASSEIKNTIKSIEKCKIKPYRVSENSEYLIYFGHNLKTKDLAEAKKRALQKTGEQFFEEDIKTAEGIISRISYAKELNQHQFDALVSISYSIGYLPSWFVDILKDVDLLTPDWIKKMSDGILKIKNESSSFEAGIDARRKIERDVFLSGKYYSAPFECK